MIVFLVVRLGLSLMEIGALTLPQAQILIEESARMTDAQSERADVPTAIEPEACGGEILLDALYDAVKSRMGGI